MDELLLSELKRQHLVCTAGELLTTPQLRPSGLPALDSACGGGLPQGRLVELVVGLNGGASVLHSVLATTAGDELAAVIDPQDGFDPLSAASQGVDLERLLWVRDLACKQALRAAELILDAGGFSVLALLLPEAPAGRPSVWLRLDKLARQYHVLVLVISKQAQVGSLASLVVVVGNCRPCWCSDFGSTGGWWLDQLELSFSVARKRYSLPACIRHEGKELSHAG